MRSPLIFRIFKKDQIFVVKQFIDNDRVIIGHGGEVDIDLPSAEISPIHCLIERRDNHYYICDLGSELGTFKKNKPILDEVIRSGETFNVGMFKIEFTVGTQRGNVITPDFSSAAKNKSAIKNTTGNINKSDLKDVIRPITGSCVEVIVSWQDRIINTYHFASKENVKLGINEDIYVPEGAAPRDWKLLNLTSGVVINLSDEMQAEVIKSGETKALSESQYKLSQGEACFIKLINGMSLAVRYAPKAPIIVFESPFVLGASEMAGVLSALIVAVLASIIVSISKPKMQKQEENIERVAQVVFSQMPRVKSVTEDVKEVVPVVEEVKVKTEVKKALLLDQKQESKAFGNPAKPDQKLQKEQKAGRAAEVKPKNEKLASKIFTSVKQGAAIKTGETNGANASSRQIDPNNSGLLAAFGSGGSRTKLDQVYSGSGETIGAGEKATGTAGFNTNRNGNDLGSSVKDTGAGGFGTATVGISGVGTVGRSTGMSGYGSGAGFGDKDRVQISAGGNEESFVGSIDKEAVRRVVRSALPQFKACYEREYRQNTKLEGKLVITWEIHEQGIAKNARIVKNKSTINNTVVEECVRARMLALRFPEPPVGTAAEVTFPFVFQGQKL